MKRVVLFGVVVLFPLLSCSDATGPVAIVSATVTSLTMSSQGGLDATLDVEMTNATSHSIYVATCATSLERLTVPAEWVQVWTQACFLTTNTDQLIISAGASISVPVRITASRNGVTWPSGGLEGLYRLRFTVRSPLPVAFRGMLGVQYRSESLTTNQFVLDPI